MRIIIFSSQTWTEIILIACSYFYCYSFSHYIKGKAAERERGGGLPFVSFPTDNAPKNFILEVYDKDFSQCIDAGAAITVQIVFPLDRMDICGKDTPV